MIKYLILFLVIIILIFIIFHQELVKIPSYQIETFYTVSTIYSDSCYVRNQEAMNVNMEQCNIYYTSNINLCDLYPELYKLSIYQLTKLKEINTDPVQYNGKGYIKADINNILIDKKSKNLSVCNFKPTNLYEIKKYDGNSNLFTYDAKRQYGCFLPLSSDDIDGNNINDSIISKYGANINNSCISGTNKAPITNITCVGTNCPISNNFHVIKNFDNIQNNYSININNDQIFLKIYDITKVAFVRYDNTTNTLENITNLSTIINKYDTFYEIKYKNPNVSIRYPKFNLTSAITNNNGIRVSVYSSSGVNSFNVFNDNDIGWDTTSTINTEYFSQYPGEFLKFDLGETIVLKDFDLYPNSQNSNKSPKNFRIYATNNELNYNNLGSPLNIIENGIPKFPTKIGDTDSYYYAFTNTDNNNSITFLKNTICDILIIGGGAAGKNSFGGSSSGGVLYYRNINMNLGNYNIIVGKGGVSNGENGSLSKIINSASNEISAVGGVSSTHPNNGASGTGNNINTINNVAATINKIAMGGNNITDRISSPNNNIRGGGGGAGGAGGAGSDANRVSKVNGLNYIMYDNISGSQNSIGVVPNLNYDWGGGDILGWTNRRDHVKINFKGFIRIPDNGIKNIIFKTRVDDGFKMSINNIEIINSWRDQGPLHYNGESNNISLEGDRIYPIDIWFYERGGGAVIQLFWNYYGPFSIISTEFFTTSFDYGFNGGDGILNNITGTDLYYAGGGASYNDNLIYSIDKRGNYGYGGNSYKDSYTSGGNGIVIIRFTIPKNYEDSNGNNWIKIYEHSHPIEAPNDVKNYSIINAAPYRYYAIVVNRNWIDNNYGCSISKLKLFGYQQSVENNVNIPTPAPAIYASPKNFNSDAYLFTFDSNNKISEYNTNTINFSLRNFMKNNNYITDKLLNTNNDTPVYGKISRIISEYINRKNSGIGELNLSQIDAKIVEYNNDNANIGNQISNSLTYYKNDIFNEFDISDMSFDKYENYNTLSNGKFYLSNDDNIYIKL